MSQQNIRQRCFGGDDWSWKRLLVLVFPFHRRPRRSNRDGSEKNVNIINQTGRPAALLVGKLTTVGTIHNDLVCVCVYIFAVIVHSIYLLYISLITTGFFQEQTRT